MTLRRDVQRHWRAGVLVVLVFLLAGYGGACAAALRGPPSPEPYPADALLGGEGWRVFDVVEADSLTLVRIREHWEAAMECVGVEEPPEFGDYRWFSANIISHIIHFPDGSWSWTGTSGTASVTHGMVVVEHGWVYLERAHGRRTEEHVTGTLIHELVHIGTGLDHPVVDRLIGKCAGEYIGQERYRRVYERGMP